MPLEHSPTLPEGGLSDHAPFLKAIGGGGGGLTEAEVLEILAGTKSPEAIKTGGIATGQITSGLIKPLAVITSVIAEEAVTVAKLASAIVERLLPAAGVEARWLHFAGGKPEWAVSPFNIGAFSEKTFTAVEAETEQEPSATEATFVTMYFNLEKLEATQFKVESGLTALFEFNMTPKTAGEFRQCSFILGKGKKWKVHKLAGAYGVHVTYLPLGAGS